MTRAPARMIVVGGGFAGLESAFLLRSKLGSRAKLTLVSDRERAQRSGIFSSRPT